MSLHINEVTMKPQTVEVSEANVNRLVIDGNYHPRPYVQAGGLYHFDSLSSRLVQIALDGDYVIEFINHGSLPEVRAYRVSTDSRGNPESLTGDMVAALLSTIDTKHIPKLGERNDNARIKNYGRVLAHRAIDGKNLSGAEGRQSASDPKYRAASLYQAV